MDETLLPGEDRGLGAVQHMEFAQNITDVTFDSFFTDNELFSDGSIGEAIGSQAQDFKLSIAQVNEQIWCIALRAANLLHNPHGHRERREANAGL